MVERGIGSLLGYNVGRPASAAVRVADNDDEPEIRDHRTYLATRVTALHDKYAKLRHNSLNHRHLYPNIGEALKKLNGQRSRLDTGWYAMQLIKTAINTATEFGDR